MSSTRLPRSQKLAWFKKGSGTVSGTARDQPSVGARLGTTVPDPFSNHAQKLACAALVVCAFWSARA